MLSTEKMKWSLTREHFTWSAQVGSRKHSRHMLTGLVGVRARVSQPGARGLGDRARVWARVRVRVRVSRPGARGLGGRCAALQQLGVEDLGRYREI